MNEHVIYNILSGLSTNNLKKFVFKMSHFRLSLSVCCFLLLGSGCHRQFNKTITVPLEALDRNGLRGGEVTVHYEFCIPKDEKMADRVRRIDRTIELYPYSRGRSGCDDARYLCIGHTGQPRYRRTLRRLARLPFVHRIRECHFE